MSGRSPPGRACGPADLSRDASQPEALVPNAWQGIKTAPTDGTIVWIASAHSLCVAYYTYGEWRNWFKGPRYENVRLGDSAFAPEPVWFEPTHWQPVPQPPAKAMEAQRAETLGSVHDSTSSEGGSPNA